MLFATKLLCSAAAVATAACTYVHAPTADAMPVSAIATLTAENGAGPVGAAAAPQFPDHQGAPVAVCPWSPCDIGALFAMGAR